MSTRPTDPTVSLSTRRAMYGVIIICGINYLMRLFSISFLGVFRWYPDSWRQMAVDETVFLEVLAWLEFGVITALILIIASLCLAFIYLREIVKFIAGGWSNVTMNATSFWTMLGMLVIVGGGLAAVSSGPNALVGTRAVGIGLPILMLIVALLTAGIVAVIFAYVLEPKGMQAGFDQRHKGIRLS